MITSAIKKQTSVCFYLINPYMVFQTWNQESWGKKRKRKAIRLLAYIDDVSCVTNHSFYMQTLSLSKRHTVPGVDLTH